MPREVLGSWAESNDRWRLPERISKDEWYPAIEEEGIGRIPAAEDKVTPPNISISTYYSTYVSCTYICPMPKRENRKKERKKECRSSWMQKRLIESLPDVDMLTFPAFFKAFCNLACFILYIILE